ncbi:MAG: DUF255 domain-containing protein [bacterium]|nr:DUF255 domain-containing protein [bacterium]
MARVNTPAADPKTHTSATWASISLFYCLLGAQVMGQESKPDMHQYTNALIDSTSPYLLQHAHNPVNWMPWGPEAFARAKAEGKPIFVSIGYSTCYWCHVMERESFENEQVAKVLNEHYIAIKVDREERPDIDEQLMLATQLLTGRGGWPNSVWLTQDGRPWMAGTYFPREAFMDALEKLAQVWKSQPENVDKQADSLTQAVRRAASIPNLIDETEQGAPLQQALSELAALYDSQNAGFGTAPKFPPHGSLRLLSLAAAAGDSKAEEMLSSTLDAMWCGGIHDHIGGGFHRYSTDESWLLPHFEKMLYDNAQLIRAFTEAYVVTRNENYRHAVDDIVGWVEREMTHPEGAFYSALDSESEGGEEGRFYTWSLAELKEVLGEQDAKWVAEFYHATAEGNFTEEATGERPGTNILHLRRQQIESAQQPKLAAVRSQLLLERQQRDRPHLDDKVLMSWNGLMISALARAGDVFEQVRYLDAAERASEFLIDRMRTADGLLRSWRQGRASLPAYLDDYVYFIEGLLELHAASRDPRWLELAQELSRRMLELFEDRDAGGFYFTNSQHEDLLLRSKNIVGGGNLPVANGVAAQVLLRLHQETGDRSYLESATKTLRAFSALMRRSPRQVEHLVLAQAQWAAQRGEASLDSDRAPPNPVAQFGDEVLQITILPTRPTLAAGDIQQMEFKINIAPGFRIYRPQANALPVDSLDIGIKDSEVVELGSFEYPAGERKRDAILQATLETYADQLRIMLPVQVRSQVPSGVADFVLIVRYQACDSQRCLETRRIEIPMQIVVK